MPDRSPATLSRLRRVLRKLGFSLVPLVVLIILLEGTFRVAGLGRPERPPHTDDEAVEVERSAPDGRRSTYREKTHAGVLASVNELGCRDWLYHEEERQGAIRIAAIGDSFTFGQGARLENTWVRRLEDHLRADLPENVAIRVMNFGRLGANTSDESTFLRDRVLSFGPRLVILQFTLFNDAETRARPEWVPLTWRPSTPPLHRRIATWAHQNSYLVHYVIDFARRPVTRQGMIDRIQSQYSDQAPGFQECRASLRAIAEACEGARIPLVFFIFPAHHDDVALNNWDAYDFVAVHRRVEAVLEPFPNAHVVDLLRALSPLNGEKIWVEGDRHPNGLYHARVARILSPEVRNLVLRIAGCSEER